MINLLKAEFGKLLTVRSTYVTTALGLIITIFGAFYIEGYTSIGAPFDENKLSIILLGVVSTTAQFAAIIAILQVAHEYRYNTIIYTLTNSNSRTKVFIAKSLALLSYAAVFTIIAAVMAYLSFHLALVLRYQDLPAQNINLLTIALRGLFYVLGFTAMGLVFVFLLRSIAASVVLLFFLPGTVETLLSLVLKDNAQYLPYMALNQVVHTSPGQLSPGRAAIVYCLYIVPSAMLAWWLFKRRDAN